MAQPKICCSTVSCWTAIRWSESASGPDNLTRGVHEVTAEAAQVGRWGFACIQDLSNFYTDLAGASAGWIHVHSILKNETRNTVGVKGSGDTYKPVPFFMSLRGYGLWVDTSDTNTNSAVKGPIKMEFWQPD